jgi:hypothetical protein
MSAVWEVGPEAAAAQLAATIARADQGAGFSRVRIYSTPQPATVTTPRTDLPQAEVVLLKPCAAIVGGALVFQPHDVTGTLVLSTGLPRWADWVAADGSIIATSNCTDAANGGGWQLQGGDTPPGEISPMLYAGGLVQLGATALM